MKLLLPVVISLIASTIGAICGIGGGIIIKPALDMAGIYDLSTVGLLSAFTAFSMSMYSVLRNAVKKEIAFQGKTIIYISLGAVAGGFFGNHLFDKVMEKAVSESFVLSAQAVILIILTVITIIYTLLKGRIRTLDISNRALIIVIGFMLGSISSFLGIGGGPFNLMFLSIFFSMDTKKASIHSIFIILFSQGANLIFSFIKNDRPDCNIGVVLLMILCGVLGGIAGRSINKRLKSRTVDVLFICVMVAIVMINVHNFGIVVLNDE